MLRPIRSASTIIEASSATEFHPLWDRREEWERRIEMIVKARSYLHLSTLYVEWDDYGREILEELLRAQRRGVAINLIIDRFGQRLGGTQMSKSDRASLRSKLNEIRSAGGDVLMYSPRKLIDRCIGCGHHIKIQYSEAGEAIFGSGNLTRSSFEGWNEFSVALRGPIVDLMVQDFHNLLGRRPQSISCSMSDPTVDSDEMSMSYWSYNPNEDSGWWGAISRRDENPLTQMYAERIGRARNRIQMSSFYYKPARAIAKAIEEACSRGVTVDVYHSHASALNTSLPWLAAATDYPLLTGQGVNIYENRHGEHSKIIMIDEEWASFGSYNFEVAADSRWAEAMLVTKNPEILAAIRSIFTELASAPDNDHVTAKSVRTWSLRQRLATKLIRPIRNWL